MGKSLGKRISKQAKRATSFAKRLSKNPIARKVALWSTPGWGMAKFMVDKAKQFAPAVGQMFGVGGSGGGEEDASFRSAAAKRIQGTKKQAGAGQISFNEEVWE